MANDNGIKAWNILKDAIQILILPLMYLVWTMVTQDIRSNAEVLKKVESNQIRVIGTLSTLEDEIHRIEAQHATVSAERARIHHTSNRSCLECKMPGMERYPISPPAKNPFMQK